MYQLDAVLQFMDSEQSDGYGNTPIPSTVDDDVSGLVGSLAALDACERRALVSRMNERHGFVLLAFAERMATLAVRDKRPDLIARGLDATAIAAALLYIKEALPIVSLLFRSAERLGVDLRATSDKVISLGDKDFEAFVRRFPDRSKADRSVEAMGYVETQGQDGFLYERTW